MSASSEQINQWLTLLTLNLLVMSSMLMQMLMAEEIYNVKEKTETRKHGEETKTSRRMGT